MFRFVKRVLKAYTIRDIYLTIFGIIVFLLMILKMIVFPYGMLGFGESNIYTEAIVSRNGFQALNPLFADFNEADREASRLIFSGLMKYDSERKAIIEDMASLVISSDNKEYIFTVRDDIYWHDGVKFSVDDVFFTYNDIILNPSFQNYLLKANFTGVKIEKIDDKRIKFVLDKPNSFFISNLLLGILPKHKLENVDPGLLIFDDFNKKPIGTGPFMVKDAVEKLKDGSMKLTLYKNPKYYEKQGEIEILRLFSFLSMDDLIDNINSINAVVRITGNYFEYFENHPRFNVVSYELPQYTAIYMNMESEYLRNKKVRIALQKAVDKEVLLKNFIDKKAVDTPLLELEQNAWVYQPNMEEAHGALKDAGFLYPESDTHKTGFRFNEDNKALELTMITRHFPQGTAQYEDNRILVSYLMDVWEEIGADIYVEFLYDNEFEDRISRRDYDLLLVGQNMGYNLDTYAFWHSSQATINGLNFSNYKSFSIDSIITDIRLTFDNNRRLQQLNLLAKQISEDLPAIFLFRPVYYYALDKKISGVSLDSIVFPSDRYASISKWEFKK